MQLWCTAAPEAPSAALLPGVIAGRTPTLLPHFQRVIEISRGDNASGSHDSCLDIAGGWRQQPLFVFQPLCLFQYSIYITSTRPSRVVSPFINCSKAKQTWATHSSSRSSWFFIVSINLFHQYLVVAATAVKHHCNRNIMLITIAVRFIFFPFFHSNVVVFSFWLILGGCEPFSKTLIFALNQNQLVLVVG